jgi:hypothetical protein
LLTGKEGVKHGGVERRTPHTTNHDSYIVREEGLDVGGGRQRILGLAREKAEKNFY